ncbi:MAG TPA: hypothetical protein VIR02_01040, partial [Anaerolineales bacterium]
MNVLFDIFSVLKEHWQLLAGMVSMIIFGQILISSVLRMIFRDRLASEDYFALSAAGWMLPLSLASVLWLALGMFLPVPAGALLFMILTAILALGLFLRARREPVPASKAILWILLVMVGASIFLRLALVNKVILPLYFDSAQHYQITSNLIRSLVSNQSPLLSPPAGMYYHTGFHFMTAWMASILRADILDV